MEKKKIATGLIGVACIATYVFYKKRIQSALEEMLSRLDDWAERTLDSDGYDVVIRQLGDETIFWPISQAAKDWMTAHLSDLPKKRGGYVVPEPYFNQVHDTLHRGPCPKIKYVWGLEKAPTEPVEVEF